MAGLNCVLQSEEANVTLRFKMEMGIPVSFVPLYLEVEVQVSSKHLS